MPRFWLFFGGLALSGMAQAYQVLGDHGQRLRLARVPQRVVSLLPSLTETVCVLGACNRLVGVDRYSNWPDAVQRLPQLGGGLDPSIEAVVAVRPDLILMAGSTRGSERFQSLGLTVLKLEPRTRADAQRAMFTVAQVLGIPEARARSSWQGIELGVQHAASQLTKQARAQRVYVEVSPSPHGASESSFIGEMLQVLGVSNILPAAMGPFPMVSPEFVVRAQPDVVVAGDSSRQSMLLRPGWSGLKAFREHRVCIFPQAQADILVRAGPRMAEGAQLLVDCLNRVASLPTKGLP